MPNFLFLIPPSEGKQPWWTQAEQKVSFEFELPLQIAQRASEKDLKCIGKRYAEALALNANLGQSGYLPAIQRYSGIMYDAINYAGLSQAGKAFFDEKVLIASGLYGLLRPQDWIANYKLPIETSGLLAWRGPQVRDRLLALDVEFIINLLPKSYEKLLHLKTLAPLLQQTGKKLISIQFVSPSGKPLSHGSKPVRGRWLAQVCEQGEFSFPEDDYPVQNLQIVV